MMLGPFYFDWTVLLILPALLLSIWAQIKVTSTFNKSSQIFTRKGVTGYQAARRILDANGLDYVRIERTSGHLTDHFDPRQNVIRLSESVYDRANVAAVGVAAHEAGHALQYAKDYSPIKLRAAILPVTRYGSMLAMPLFFIGLLFASNALMLGGIVLYSAVALFQLVTLPVEFNASRRAMASLESFGVLVEDEPKYARKVLSAAALTYVAALLTSLLTLLRLIILSNNRRR
jgi:Zn-dependent membrane protease YugP